jgi:RNA polymerase sigma factor (sigma-70 family)
VDDDKLIIEEILGGKTDSFRILIDRYQRLVAHIVFRLIPNLSDREEICQEIFIKVYQNLSTFKFNSKLSTWIGRIAFNACMNQLRKEKIALFDDLRFTGGEDNIKQDHEILAAIRSGQKSPDTDTEKHDRSRIIQECIAELPAPYRLIITMFHLDELSYQEIAGITGLPEGTIKSHLFRARKMLKENLVVVLKGEEIWS